MDTCNCPKCPSCGKRLNEPQPPAFAPQPIWVVPPQYPYYPYYPQYPIVTYSSATASATSDFQIQT